MAQDLHILGCNGPCPEGFGFRGDMSNGEIGPVLDQTFALGVPARHEVSKHSGWTGASIDTNLCSGQVDGVCPHPLGKALSIVSEAGLTIVEIH